jgi:oxygen-dependent protoporphyrinogen oxidase
MRVDVIGAGLSGLATAWYLADAGARVCVRDASTRPGGLIQTIHRPEGLVETAARGFTWTPRTGALFEAAGLQPRFAREASKRRYIFRDGRATRWPLTPLETAGAAARFGRAWVARQVPPRPAETVATWGTRVFGRAATMWLLAPALQGIYASPPAELSASALFGKTRAPRGKLTTPAGGMGELINRLHDRLCASGVSFEFGCAVSAADLNPSIKTVICTSAPEAARLLTPHAPALASAVGRIRMVSIVVATAFFEPDAKDLKGFGVLFPRSSGVRALGALFNAEIFEDRSRMRSETWFYGDLDALALPATDTETAALISTDRAVLTGRSDPPVACYVTRHRDALPVYDAAILDALAALPDLPPRLAIAGNYLGRLGVSSLLEGASDAASRVCRGGVATSAPRPSTGSERPELAGGPARDGERGVA